MWFTHVVILPITFHISMTFVKIWYWSGGMLKMTFAIQIKVKEDGVRAAFSIFKILFGHKFFYLWYMIFISSSEAKTNPMAFQKESLGFVAQHYHKLKSIRWFKGKNNSSGCEWLTRQSQRPNVTQCCTFVGNWCSKLGNIRAFSA